MDKMWIPKRIEDQEHPKVQVAWQEFNTPGKIEMLFRGSGDELVCMQTDNKELVAIKGLSGEVIYK